MKKILILSATSGEGHNSISKALKKGFEEKGAEVKIVDFYKECSNRYKTWTLDKGYKLACKYARPIYNACYSSLIGKKGSKTSNRTLNKLNNIIEEHKPDVVIATHIFVATTLANLKEKFGLKAISVYVVTDYSEYPYVADTAVLDYIILPHENMVSQFLEMGFNESQILPYGIPVDAEFSVYRDKAEARSDLGLDDKFTLLVMTGGGGFGNIQKLLKQSVKAEGNYQIICINGKDQKSYKRIKRFVEKNNLGNVTNLGYVDSVVPYMNASDCMLGKCGAINLTEALNAWVPVICRNKLVLQELNNYEFMRDFDAIIGFRKYKDLPNLLSDIISNGSTLNNVKKNILKVRKLNATNDIVDTIMSY